MRQGFITNVQNHFQVVTKCPYRKMHIPKCEPIIAIIRMKVNAQSKK